MSAEQEEKGMEKYFFRASAEDFKKIPGSSMAYWLSNQQRKIFEQYEPFSSQAIACQGLATTDNNRFVRLWTELAYSNIGFAFSSSDAAKQSGLTWFPLDKGGQFRKWFGNNEFVVNWMNNGHDIKANIIKKYPYLNGNPNFVAKNPDKYFLSGITWGKITSGSFSARYSPEGSIFSDAGMKAFCPTNDLFSIAGFFNSNITPIFLSALSETLNYEQGNIARLPYKTIDSPAVTKLIHKAKSDWDSYETSWDFTTLPLLNPQYRQDTLEATYSTLRAHWRTMTQEMLQLEQENNRIFIEAYGLQDELTPDVPLKEITLTCNPHYRYGGDKTDAELDALLLADTMRELISYAVGCMFGRYSLDKPGLILANQGETLTDYQQQVPTTRFPADDNNVIPMLDNDWFADDIALRFREFLRITFGEENYEENLNFVTQALNIGNKRNYSLRDYFLKEFYNDHLKRYKKRPIYWLFTSPRGGFNALIYMHRYRSDTVSVVLNDYLREFRAKQAAHKANLEHIQASTNSSPAEKTRALKEIERVSKLLSELDEYERDILYPLATEQLEIDLDDGVKVNYPKFGAALKKIPGLEAKED